MVNMGTNSDERKIIDRVLHRDMVFRYQLLGRLQTDCEYYLNYGNRNIKRLWAGNVNLQIKLMVELYNSFKEDEKPQWLTMDEIIASASDGLETAVTNHNHSEQSRCISATFLF